MERCRRGGRSLLLTAPSPPRVSPRISLERVPEAAGSPRKAGHRKQLSGAAHTRMDDLKAPCSLEEII